MEKEIELNETVEVVLGDGTVRRGKVTGKLIREGIPVYQVNDNLDSFTTYTVSRSGMRRLLND